MMNFLLSRTWYKQNMIKKIQAMDNLANKLENYNFSRDYEILLKDTTGMTEQQL